MSLYITYKLYNLAYRYVTIKVDKGILNSRLKELL